MMGIWGILVWMGFIDWMREEVVVRGVMRGRGGVGGDCVKEVVG